jgi:hypothetical protein
MDLLPELYDPRSSRALVRAHRPHAGGAASDVVSDAVWSDVLGLVRWAQATLCCSGEMVPGVAWLWSRLRTPEEEVPLGVLAVDVDAVGAAAVGLVAEGADWERMG